MGEQILQQLEVQQHLNPQRRNISSKLTPFSPLPMLEGNTGQQCSITDCSSRHTCKGQVWQASWEIHLQKTTYYSRLVFFPKPGMIWSHVTSKYKTFHYSLSHTAHPCLPPSQSYSSWKEGQLLNHGEMTLSISTLYIFWEAGSAIALLFIEIIWHYLILRATASFLFSSSALIL